MIGPWLVPQVDQWPDEVGKRQDLQGGARGTEEHELRTSALALPPGGEQRNGPRGAEEGDFSQVDEN